MKYVVLGASAAGINGARELRRLDPESEIILISSDRAVYSRCILHHYLGGERNLEQLSFAEKEFDRKYRIHWMKGRTAAGLDRAGKAVILEDGERVTYDKLLIATGSHTYIPPIRGIEEAKTVYGFRNIQDMDRLKEAAQQAENIVVMGAGLVGLDCAMGFYALGVKVTLVEYAGWLLNRQLDPRAARTYEEAFEKAGIRQYYGVGIEEVVPDGDKRLTEALLTDGTRLPCGCLVVTAGVRPNVEFLEGAGLRMGERGLYYDETGRTSDPDIYGAGDVSGNSPIWPAAVKEGLIAAANMAGQERKMTDFFASKATMNFLGIPTMSLGQVNPKEGEASEEILETKDSYKKIIHKDGTIIGAILQNDLAYSGILQQLIARKINITKVKKPIFSIDYSDFFHIKENLEYDYQDEREN